MSITPIELRKAEFKKNMMGYNTDEVTALLSSAADTLEDLRREVSGLREKNKGLEDKLESYQGLERTLNETLIMAQKASDSSRQNAERESDLIISQAEIQAEKLISKAKTRLLELNVEIEELEHQKHAYLMRLRSLVASQWKMLQEEEAEEARFKQDINRVHAAREEETVVPDVPVRKEASVVEGIAKEKEQVKKISAESVSEDFGKLLEQNVEENGEKPEKVGDRSLLPDNESEEKETPERESDDFDDNPRLFWGEDDESEESQKSDK